MHLSYNEQVGWRHSPSLILTETPPSTGALQSTPRRADRHFTCNPPSMHPPLPLSSYKSSSSCPDRPPMNFQSPAPWGDSSSSNWSPNFVSQTSSHNYQHNSSSSQSPLTSYDPYAHLTRDYTSSYSQQRGLSTVSPHGPSQYPSMNQFTHGLSSTSSAVNDSPSRLTPQTVKKVASFSEGNQSQFNEELNMASTTDVVHAYRRLSAEEEQLSESTFGEQGSSTRKKPGSHNTSRQQLPAKFECVACHARFSYESSAKRHQLNQVKRFRCNVCNQKFARVDYRNWHQRRCESGFRLSVLDQSPG